MPLFDPDRHEPLNQAPWDAAEVRSAIQQIASDCRSAASSDGLWPNHPEDVPDGSPPMTMLYLGATGVIWGLEFLAGEGAIEAGPSYTAHLREIERSNHTVLEAIGANTRSYLIGDAGILLCRWNSGEDVLEELREVISGNTHEPVCELMWGAPGTMLVALELYRSTGDSRFADLFVSWASTLERTIDLDTKSGAYVWAQKFPGQTRHFLGAVHGFAGNAYVLIRGRDLLSSAEWSVWADRLTETLSRTAIKDDGGVNWPSAVGENPTSLLVQHCHGAPGMVTCLAGLSTPIDDFLIKAGELIWAAGPLRKGANLCHGTAGNGYAFLKLFERTADEKWLDRARAFAMHAIGQSERAAVEFGRRRYSLWTGDIGLALYLWNCLCEKARFPTMDVL